MFTIEIVNSIKDLAKAEWDAMIYSNVFASYGWLKTVEETLIENVIPNYFIVKDSEKLIGAAVCYIFNKSDYVGNIDSIIFGRLKKYVSKLGISFMPAFICCPFWCHGKHFLFARRVTPQEKKNIIKELLNTIEVKASKEKLSLTFTNIMDNETELINLLNNRRYNKAVLLPLNYLDIKWSSFSEYMTHLKNISRGTKKAVKREINKNRKEGIIINNLINFEKYEDRLYELINNNYYKHNKRSFLFNISFLKRLKDNFGEDMIPYVALKEGIITGVCILLKKNNVGSLLAVGVDHEKSGNDFTYFNIAYYRPIMDAISEKMTRLYYGLGMYELKARRGCKNSNVYIYYKSLNKIKNNLVKPWFALVSARNKSKLPEIARKNLEVSNQPVIKNSASPT